MPKLGYQKHPSYQVRISNRNANFRYIAVVRLRNKFRRCYCRIFIYHFDSTGTIHIKTVSKEIVNCLMGIIVFNLSDFIPFFRKSDFKYILICLSQNPDVRWCTHICAILSVYRLGKKCRLTCDFTVYAINSRCFQYLLNKGFCNYTNPLSDFFLFSIILCRNYFRFIPRIQTPDF